MEDLSAAFSEYVRSVSSPAAGHSLALALDAAECAVSYTPLLRAVDIVASKRDVVGLVVPCVRDVVAMYGRHLKEVVEDVAWPLHKLGIGMNDSVGLQFVVELFSEYMHSIVELIPRKEAAAALHFCKTKRTATSSTRGSSPC